jgi:hypothetical protein
MDQLLRETTMSDAAAGSTLFEEGDPADGVAAILEGRVEVLKHGRSLATLGPGSVLGELSVFVPSASRTATARAISPVRMIKWRADDVQGPPRPPRTPRNGNRGRYGFRARGTARPAHAGCRLAAQSRRDTPTGVRTGAFSQPCRGVACRQPSVDRRTLHASFARGRTDVVAADS